MSEYYSCASSRQKYEAKVANLRQKKESAFRKAAGIFVQEHESVNAPKEQGIGRVVQAKK